MVHQITARKTPAYRASIGRMTDREIREFEDWTWLRNVPESEETLAEWLESQPAALRARALGK